MDTQLVDGIVNAVLYEGYVLYPYRPALKNYRRWMFGIVAPRGECPDSGAPDGSAIRMHCLVEGRGAPRLEIELRFLHLIDRRVAITRDAALSPGIEPHWEYVDTLEAGGQLWQSWEEAVERRVETGEAPPGDLFNPLHVPFEFPGKRDIEWLPAPAEDLRAALIREQQPIRGVIEIGMQKLADELQRVTIRILNTSIVPAVVASTREEALRHSLVSTHVILGVQDGQFVSSIDPPDAYRAFTAADSNQGLWPVLVGEFGNRRQMLASPIILYDYPQIAGESSGDSFDATEMDEMLALRVLTLTDAEKRQVRALDDRAGAMLLRTESLSPANLLGLHGAVREMRPAGKEPAKNPVNHEGA